MDLFCVSLIDDGEYTAYIYYLFAIFFFFLVKCLVSSVSCPSFYGLSIFFLIDL